MTSVRDAAAARGAQTMWLGVWERNFRAQKFYRKFSFADIGTHTFVLGHDRQTDLLMALDLRRPASPPLLRVDRKIVEPALPGWTPALRPLTR